MSLKEAHVNTSPLSSLLVSVILSLSLSLIPSLLTISLPVLSLISLPAFAPSSSLPFSTILTYPSLLLLLSSPNQSDVWVHANCALWSGEVYEDEEGAILRLNDAVKRARQLKCSHCNENGATLGCCHTHCNRNYHFACAIDSDALFGLREVRSAVCAGVRALGELSFPSRLFFFWRISLLAYAFVRVVP